MQPQEIGKMYSVEFFRARFEPLATDELLDRLATQTLTEQAQQALIGILAERGYTVEQLEQGVLQARRDQFLRTGVDNHCDDCGRSLLFHRFEREGQKFCDVECFHASRCRRAAVDLSQDEIEARARDMKAGPCPICTATGRHPDIHRSHRIVSAIFMITTVTRQRFSCDACARREQCWAILYCLLLGWWSLKGIFLTPVWVFRNLRAMRASGRDVPTPTDALVEAATFALADERLAREGGGKYGLERS